MKHFEYILHYEWRVSTLGKNFFLSNYSYESNIISINLWEYQGSIKQTYVDDFHLPEHSPTPNSCIQTVTEDKCTHFLLSLLFSIVICVSFYLQFKLISRLKHWTQSPYEDWAK